MTYSIEDVKRLIPEAKVLCTYANGSCLLDLFDEYQVDSDTPWVQAILTTRRQLEIAREGLETIAEGAGPPECIAQKALDAINKEGE